MSIFHGNFSASKFGVNGFGEALASDLDSLGKTGIHVSTVYPGAVDTPMVSDHFDHKDLGLIFNRHKTVVKSKCETVHYIV